MIGDLKVEVLEPVLAKNRPKEEDFKQLDHLVESIYQKHKEMALI